MKNKYDVMINGEIIKSVSAESPSEAIDNVVESRGFTVSSKVEGTKENYNAVTKLVSIGGKKPSRESICYYNINYVQQNIISYNVKVLSHNAATDAYLIKDMEVKGIFLIYGGERHDAYYLECDRLDSSLKYAKSWHRNYALSYLSQAKELYTRLKAEHFKQMEEYKNGPARVYLEFSEPKPFYIVKAVGKEKKAFKLLNENSIPAFLRNYVKIENDEIILKSLEGIERIKKEEIKKAGCPYMVVAYEQLENGNYNVWWKKNAPTTLREKDGKFYDIPKPLLAVRCSILTPTCLGNTDRLKYITFARVNQGISNTPEWVYQPSWSNEPLYAKINKGIWVKYGEGDLNYVELGTESANSYKVCDVNGNILCSLSEYFKENK